MRRSALLLAALLLLSGCGPINPVSGSSAPTPIETPAPWDYAPALTVACGERSVEAVGGAVYWEWENEDGTKSCMRASLVHAIDLWTGGLAPLLELGQERRVNFRFDTPPDKVTLRYWTTDGTDGAYNSERKLPVAAVAAELPDGLCIYEVYASWDREAEEGWKGTARYVFSAE